MVSDNVLNESQSDFGASSEPHLRRFLFSRTGNRSAAADLLQQTLMRFHTARSQFEAGTSVAAWAFAVARSSLIDTLRASRNPFRHGHSIAMSKERATEADPEGRLETIRRCSVEGEDSHPSFDEITRTLEKIPSAARALSFDLPEGMMVGEYRIENKLGEGGFGTVYGAIHPVIGKRVAIKVLNQPLASSRALVSRFIVEARAVNQIRHRNIVDIFSFGTLEDGRCYFVMELLEGMTLRDYLHKHGRIDPREAIAILRPLARALDAAHSAGIAHRDVKPDNVFLVLEADGHISPKLIDFGLAKLLDGHESMDHRTQTGAPMGTPKYMSPEQCRGGAIDHRTDLYSLGVVVHEILTGTRPFETGGMLELFLQHTTVAPRPMSTSCSAVPPTLDGPVLQMLAKKPEDRPASVCAAIDALSRVIDASMPSSTQRAVAPSRPSANAFGRRGRSRIGIAPARHPRSAVRRFS